MPLKIPWYALPALYRECRDRLLRRNQAYLYYGYGDIFRRYFLRDKDPVIHPLWQEGRK